MPSCQPDRDDARLQPILAALHCSPEHFWGQQSWVYQYTPCNRLRALLRDHLYGFRYHPDDPIGQFDFLLSLLAARNHLREAIRFAREFDRLRQRPRLLTPNPIEQTGWLPLLRWLLQIPEQPDLDTLFRRYADAPPVRTQREIDRLIPMLPSLAPWIFQLPSRAETSHACLQILIHQPIWQLPNASDCAHQLGCSSRTLGRRLRAEGQHYQQLLDQLRLGEACVLMQLPALPLTAISDYLGYPEPSAFHRAFRRQFNQTPAVYRRGILPES